MKTIAYKANPGTKQEEERSIAFTEIDIELPDIKKECLKHFDKNCQTSGKAISFKYIFFITVLTYYPVLI